MLGIANDERKRPEGVAIGVVEIRMGKVREADCYSP